MQRLLLAFTVLLALTLTASGCSSAPPPSAGTSANQVAALQAQNAGLQGILSDTAVHVRVYPEPAAGAPDGLFMAQISAVTTGSPYPVLTLDFVSDREMPGTDSHVWNQYRRLERLALSDGPSGRPPAVVLPTRSGLEVVVAADLPRAFAAHKAEQAVYYVAVSGGKVTKVWPVAFP